MNILIIGGLGIIGKSLAQKASNLGHTVIIIDRRENTEQIVCSHFIKCDKTNLSAYEKALSSLNNHVDKFDIVVDILPIGIDDAGVLLKSVGKITTSFVILSSTLVYDRMIRSGVISEDFPLAKINTQGEYVDNKLIIEEFWSTRKNINCMILRPYHIIGPGCNLGCAPAHNRDPLLIQKILQGGSIRLFKNGDYNLSFINVDDLSEYILRAMKNYGVTAYNVAYSKSFLASEYYQHIASILQKYIIIEELTTEEVIDSRPGWEMMFIPHEYTVTKICDALDFKPGINLYDSLKEVVSLNLLERNFTCDASDKRLNRGDNIDLLSFLETNYKYD